MAAESRHITGLKNTVFSLLSIPIICPKTIVNICGTMQKNSGVGLQMWVNVPKALLEPVFIRNVCGFSSIILLQSRQKSAGGLSPGKDF
jgi:hypothetical protein